MMCTVNCFNKTKLFSKVGFVTGVTLANGTTDLILILCFVGYTQHHNGREHHVTITAYTVFNFEISQTLFFTKLGLILPMLLASSLLSYGVRKKKRFHLLPWLGCILAMTMISGLSLKDSLRHFGMINMNVVRLGGFLILLNLNLLCVWLIVAFYKELERERLLQSSLNANNQDERAEEDWLNDSQLDRMVSDDLEMSPTTLVPPFPGSNVAIISSRGHYTVDPLATRHHHHAPNSSLSAGMGEPPPDYDTVIAQDQANRLTVNLPLLPSGAPMPPRSPPPQYSEVIPNDHHSAPTAS